jgi:hypothetical protein
MQISSCDKTWVTSLKPNSSFSFIKCWFKLIWYVCMSSFFDNHASSSKLSPRRGSVWALHMVSDAKGFVWSSFRSPWQYKVCREPLRLVQQCGVYLLGIVRVLKHQEMQMYQVNLNQNFLNLDKFCNCDQFICKVWAMWEEVRNQRITV